MFKAQKHEAFSLSEILVALGIIGILCVSMLSLNSMSDNNYKVAATKLSQVDSALKSWGKAISKSNETGLGARQVVKSQESLENSLSLFLNTQGIKANASGKLSLGGKLGENGQIERTAEEYKGYTEILLDNGTTLNVKYIDANNQFSSSDKTYNYNKYDSVIAVITANVAVRGKEQVLTEEYALKSSGVQDYASMYEGWDKYVADKSSDSTAVIGKDDDGNDITEVSRTYVRKDADGNPIDKITTDAIWENIYAKTKSATPCGYNQTGSKKTLLIGTPDATYDYEIDECCDMPFYYNAASTNEDKCECVKSKMTFGAGQVFTSNKDKKCIDTVQKGSYATGGEEFLCDVGYFCPVDGMDRPRKCEKGYICPNDTTTVDKTTYTGKKYPDGTSGTTSPSSGSSSVTILNGGLIDQVKCPAGYYCPDEGMTGVTDDKKCPVGYYCPEGSVNPTKCPAGSTSIVGSENASACEPCSAGTYEESGVCKPCADNAVSTGGSTKCSVCPAGKYMNLETKNCEPCKKGYYCPVAGIVDSELMSKYLCKDGMYQDETGQTSCKNCPANSHVKVDENGVAVENGGIADDIKYCLCDAGYGTDANGTLQSATVKCQQVDDTHYSPDVDNKIYACRAHSHALVGRGSSDKRECICDNGYYFDRDEKDYDKQCKNDKCGVYSFHKDATGKWTGNNSRVQVGMPFGWDKDVPYFICPANTYTDKTTGRYESDCKSLSNGYILAEDKCSQIKCEDNSSPNAARTACECNPGYYMEDGKCVPCPCGTYKTEQGNSKDLCVACSGNTFITEENKGATSADACQSLTEGYIIADDHCSQIKCEDNSSPDPTLTACECNPGYYMEDGKCVPCPCGTYKKEAGNEKNLCTKCEENTYFAGTGGSSADVCESVGTGYTGADLNDNPVEEGACARLAFCEVGQYRDANENICKPCPCGTYKSMVGTDGIEACLACDDGYYLPQTCLLDENEECKLDENGKEILVGGTSKDECIEVSKDYTVTADKCGQELACQHYDEVYVIKYKALQQSDSKNKSTLYQQMKGTYLDSIMLVGNKITTYDIDRDDQRDRKLQ